MTIQEQQEAIIAEGFVFDEKIFPNGDTMINFKKTTQFNPYRSPHFYSDEGWRIGWGRFPRWQAWDMAYQYIVVERKADELPVHLDDVETSV